MESLLYGTLSEAGEALKKGVASPVALTRATLDRIAATQASLNAFIRVTRDSALEEAARAERELREGRWRGPLHGIPVSVKDLFDMAGTPTSAASRFLRDSVRDQDASVVATLREAGAVIVGKTNLHEFAFGTTNAVSEFGPVRNPWDPERIAGGSSGGAAVAVAAGLSFVSIGTDTGGSVRIPGALCGVTGFKPTYDRIDRTGLLDLAPELDHVGILARSVDDASEVFRILARPEGAGDAASPASPKGSIDGMRIGVLRSTMVSSDAEVEALLEQAIGVLEAAGARTEDREPEGLEAARAATAVVLVSQATATHRERIAAHLDWFSEDLQERFRRAASISGADYVHAQGVRRRFAQAVDALFEEVDLLVSAMIPGGAPRLDDPEPAVRGTRRPIGEVTTANTREWNSTGCPAMTVPCGFLASGLPVGVQLIGPRGDDAAVLRAGSAYQHHTDWHRCRPELPT